MLPFLDGLITGKEVAGLRISGNSCIPHRPWNAVTYQQWPSTHNVLLCLRLAR